MTTGTLKATGVSKKFFRKGRESAQYFNAVDNVTIELAAGELTCLMGRSGSGKSTLLNMLAGLMEPTEGTVELDGADLYRLGDGELSRVRNARMGIIPQGHTVLQSLTVEQNVTLPYLMYRAGKDAQKRALELLDSLDMAGLAACAPSELSGGELRRVAIARALVCDPDIVLADEPTGDLDDENTAVVLSTLKNLADAGKAVLLVTHEPEAANYATRMLRMQAGRLEG